MSEARPATTCTQDAQSDRALVTHREKDRERTYADASMQVLISAHIYTRARTRKHTRNVDVAGAVVSRPFCAIPLHSSPLPHSFSRPSSASPLSTTPRASDPTCGLLLVLSEERRGEGAQQRRPKLERKRNRVVHERERNLRTHAERRMPRDARVETRASWTVLDRPGPSTKGHEGAVDDRT
eukprot:6214559-Pleurochrysis_carterae.AAC.2